jgi:hypothetical protein
MRSIENSTLLSAMSSEPEPASLTLKQIVPALVSTMENNQSQALGWVSKETHGLHEKIDKMQETVTQIQGVVNRLGLTEIHSHTHTTVRLVPTTEGVESVVMSNSENDVSGKKLLFWGAEENSK